MWKGCNFPYYNKGGLLKKKNGAKYGLIPLYFILK